MRERKNTKKKYIILHKPSSEKLQYNFLYYKMLNIQGTYHGTINDHPICQFITWGSINYTHMQSKNTLTKKFRKA